MSLTEMHLPPPFFGFSWDGSFWEGSLPETAEARMTRARRAALARRARAFVELYLSEAVLELSQNPIVLSDDNAADIAFGRSDCDFLFRD